ncbi:malate dehydrogenase, NAD-dependent [Pneumocystis jirovecii RU7]|uniref:malate dehydrogenase n=1 Tax=Pneumocystis jirovecii (strain RU7) TaxID=1408657 RepID=A0A0W4ZHH5_PNEJ7|nr:malate dehydrogenase, NAD-dependent [Pneumocystis jirovecii RU7]KTW27824.1 malate dehydrogenase, NAD-dependent [Pneumocystis jirovecii RU7]
MVDSKNNDLYKDKHDTETNSFTMTSMKRGPASIVFSDTVNTYGCILPVISLSIDIQKILHYLLPLPSVIRKFYNCKSFKLADSTVIPVFYIRERISQFAPEHWLNTRTCTHYLRISPYSRRFYPIHDIIISSQCVFMPQKLFLRSSARSIFFIIKYLPHPPSFSVILHWLYTNNTHKLYRNILRAINKHKTLEWIKGFSLNIRSLGIVNQNLVDAIKVSILGAGGGIGQPLSLLLKMNSRVSELALYDIRGAPGVAADCSHINTPCKVSGYGPEENGLFKALRDADVVLVPAGVPRKPGMTRDDLFVTNASIVRDLAKFTADVAPNAHLLIISNPVNSTVPICAEVYKRKGVYNPKKLFGITTLDAVRASWFVSEMKNTDPRDENVDIVGGHSGVTIVPLLSKVSHNFTDEETETLTTRIQFAGDEVVKAKNGTGSATLSMAYAAARFTNSLLRGIQGERDVIESAYIETTLYLNKGCRFFSMNVGLGLEGIEKVYPFENTSAYEKELLEVCYVELQKNIEKGIKFVEETY